MFKKFSTKRKARGRKPANSRGRTLRHESLERREVLTAIHGLAFDDLKHHGTFDAQFDKGLAGIEITLSSVGSGGGGGGLVAPPAPPTPQMTTTDANGAFSFEHVADGTYMVSQNVPAGYSPTTPVSQWVTVSSTTVAQQIPDSGNLWFGVASAGNIVAVQKQGSDLMLLGNSSNNHVEIHQTKNPGEFMVEGKEGTLLKVNGSLVPSTTVNNIVGDVGVMLGHGDDWFKFTGADSGGQSYVKGGLTIENDWGSNMNEIRDVKVMADLDVEKVPGVWGYSALKIVDSIVQGNTIIHNGTELSNQPWTTANFAQPDCDCDFEPSGGDSKTLIENSQLKGGEVEHEFGEHTLAADFANRQRLGFGALIILNGEGFDIVDIRDTKVGVNTMADTMIHNGNGGSRTTFTSENGLGNVFYGSLGVVNGTNPVGVQVYDTVIFNKTEVQKSTVIHNMDGDSMVVVQDNSVLGASNTLETMEQGGGGASLAGPGFNPAGKLVVLNDHGLDEFLMKDSAAPYGLIINNAISMQNDDRPIDMDGQGFAPLPVPSDTMHMYGSRTDIIDSEIGTNLKSDGGFYFWGDDKDDVINVTNSWIGGRNGVMIYTYDGDDEIWFYLKGHHVSMISIDTAEGKDHVRLEEVFVTNGTEIDLGAGGLDNLELLKASHFQGNNDFDGGDGREDRYAKDIDVILENLSLNGFEDLDFGP